MLARPGGPGEKISGRVHRTNSERHDRSRPCDGTALHGATPSGPIAQTRTLSFAGLVGFVLIEAPSGWFPGAVLAYLTPSG